MKATKFFLGLCLIAGLMGCSTALVKSDFDRDVNFAGHQTFEWAPRPDKADSGYSAQNSLLEKRLRHAVEQEFAAKGFRKQTTGTPDFLITYRVDFNDKLEVTSRDNYWSASYGYWPGYYGFGFGYWPGYYNFGFGSRYYYAPGFYGIEGPYRREYREYKEVTLTLDLLNPATKELIWRGWYVDEVEDVNLQEEKIGEAVKRILEKFPPERKEDNAPLRIT